MSASGPSPILPYTISIPDTALDTLRQKLALTTFPDTITPESWSHGAPLSDIKRLGAHWTNSFSWRAAESQLNKLPQFTTKIQCTGFEALQIHFVHQRSALGTAIPLLFVHGWPGSFIEVSRIIDGLTRGGDNGPRFHVVALSLPGYGFSEGSTLPGFGLKQYAETGERLMQLLGYKEYVTQGGDWGFFITRTMGLLYPDSVKASHLNMDNGTAPKLLNSPLAAIQHTLTPYTKRERVGLVRTSWFMKEGSGYRSQQSTKPQTIGYALADSPVALLAWIYEKLHDWTDSYPWTDDEICTWVSIYWFSTAGPAANVRIYYEAVHAGEGGISRDRTVDWIPKVPLGMTHSPRELRVLPKSWTRTLGPVVFENDSESGGHFAAWEKPQVIVQDLRRMFGKGGGAYGVVEGKDGYPALGNKTKHLPAERPEDGLSEKEEITSVSIMKPRRLDKLD